MQSNFEYFRLLHDHIGGKLVNIDCIRINGKERFLRIKGRALIFLIFCLGTALVMAVSGQDDGATPDVVGAVEKKSPTTNQTGTDQHKQQADIHFDLSAIKRTVPKNIQTVGLFQSKSWYTPPHQPPANSLPPQLPANSLPPPPTPPSAPQLPFTFIGRMIDGNDVILFLSKSNRQYTAKVNDVLDDMYRVDKITDSNAVLTYLPMNIQQTLVFNSTAVGISALSASASITLRQVPSQSTEQITIR